MIMVLAHKLSKPSPERITIILMTILSLWQEVEITSTLYNSRNSILRIITTQLLILKAITTWMNIIQLSLTLSANMLLQSTVK
jgi:hypothetical protein